MKEKKMNGATMEKIQSNRLKYFPVTLFASVMGLAGLAIVLQKMASLLHFSSSWGITLLYLVSAFRLGAKAAIEKSQFSNWGEMAEQPSPVRRKFFNLLLREARPHLVTAIGKEKVDHFIEKVRAENEKNLKD